MKMLFWGSKGQTTQGKPNISNSKRTNSHDVPSDRQANQVKVSFTIDFYSLKDA